MNKIKIKSCKDCPFLSYHYDDFAIRYANWEECSLAIKLDLPEYLVKMWNNTEEGIHENTYPEWCPIDNKLMIIKDEY